MKLCEKDERSCVFTNVRKNVYNFGVCFLLFFFAFLIFQRTLCQHISKRSLSEQQGNRVTNEASRTIKTTRELIDTRLNRTSSIGKKELDFLVTADLQKSICKSKKWDALTRTFYGTQQFKSPLRDGADGGYLTKKIRRINREREREREREQLVRRDRQTAPITYSPFDPDRAWEREEERFDHDKAFRLGPDARLTPPGKLTVIRLAAAFWASIDRHSPIRYTESRLIARSAPCARTCCFGAAFRPGGHALSDQLRQGIDRFLSC